MYSWYVIICNVNSGWNNKTLHEFLIQKFANYKNV